MDQTSQHCKGILHGCSKPRWTNGAGEMYHRVTNMTQQRGCASNEACVMASVRRYQYIKTCQPFVKTYGDLVRNVFTFEWYNFKRCLQPTQANSFRPCKLTDHSFFEKNSRLNADGLVDWSQVLSDSRSRTAPPQLLDDTRVRFWITLRMVSNLIVFITPQLIAKKLMKLATLLHLPSRISFWS